MGTINYQSGDIITLGLNYRADNEAIDELMEMNDLLTREDAENFEREQYESDAQELSQEIIDDINAEIEDCDYFEKWVDIKLVNGYYEGFSVVVNKNYTLDKRFSWRVTEEDKPEIYNVLEIVRNGLKKLTDNYLDVCYPWWCTRYEEGREANYKAIDEAIDEAIEEIKDAE
jgi:hypothetical protein